MGEMVSSVVFLWGWDGREEYLYLELARYDIGCSDGLEMIHRIRNLKLMQYKICGQSVKRITFS